MERRRTFISGPKTFACSLSRSRAAGAHVSTLTLLEWWYSNRQAAEPVSPVAPKTTTSSGRPASGGGGGIVLEEDAIVLLLRWWCGMQNAAKSPAEDQAHDGALKSMAYLMVATKLGVCAEFKAGEALKKLAKVK